MSVANESGRGDRRLRDYPQWMCWKWEGKNKPPIDPGTGQEISWTDPRNWMSYEEAAEKAKRSSHANGVGIVITLYDPFCVGDFDRCFVAGPEGKEITPFASEVLRELGGVEEVSASGEGMHSLVQGEKPGDRCASKPTGREIEIYDRDRFIAIADESIVDKPIPERQEALTALYWRIFPQMPLVDEKPPQPSDGALSDAEVLELGRANRVTGKAFRTLYDHGETGGYKSRSEAHYDLCRMLGFWSGGDGERVERLFWDSALAGTVEKAKPKSYVQRTVRKAVAALPKPYEPGVDDAEKQRVRRLAERHLEWIAGLEWSSETDRAVYEQVTRHAGEWGYENAEDVTLDFNVSQQTIAYAIGKGQWTVSQALRRLIDAGMLDRLSKGHTGRNSYYKLRIFQAVVAEATPSVQTTDSLQTTTMNQQDSGGSATTTMNHPPVEKHISGNGTNLVPSHSSGGAGSDEPEPLPKENPEPDGLPEIEDELEPDEDGWVTIG